MLQKSAETSQRLLGPWDSFPGDAEVPVCDICEAKIYGIKNSGSENVTYLHNNNTSY